MKRIVYAPKVNAFVQADSGVYDLSPYLVSGSVNRKLDALSSASLSFRNPNMQFTKKAVFHPMDPIVITMSRLPDKPVQVFTGYVDTAPYASLKPGVVTMTCSCTLKKLLHTYYDPGLPFFHRFLHQRGWTMSGLGVQQDNAGRTVDEQQELDQQDGVQGFPDPATGGLNDASFGATLFDMLLYVGNWHPDSIYIENLPDGIVDLVEGIFYQIEEAGKEQRKEFKSLLKSIIGENSLGGGNTVFTTDETAWNGQTISGKVSYFGSGADAQDTASGIASTKPGLALNLRPGGGDSGWNNPTTQAWMTKARNGNPVYAKVTVRGKSAKLPIIDLGPHQDTGRAIDVTGAGAAKMGFNPISSFPTDAIGTAEII